MKYRLLLVKREIEDIVMFPLILMGKLMAFVKPLKKEYDVFYFFSFFHTGGAEKVHTLIVQTTATKDCIVFFTRKSHNKTFLQQFQQTGCSIKDISRFTDNKWLYFVNIIFRGLVSGYINSQERKPVVFNGQCNFGYKISPWIKKRIKQIELIHSLNTFSYIRIPFLPFITETVMISQIKIAEHKRLYQRFGIPQRLELKIHYIPNASDFDTINVEEKDFATVRVFYSGRATPEKRPHLVAAIAREVYQKDSSINFVMAGDEFEPLQKPQFSFIEFKGNIADSEALKNIYKSCNVLLVTSATEGFPLAVIEGMAYGCAIIATPVGDIPVHVKASQNGFLFSSVEEEQKIIVEGAHFILALKKDKALHKSICANNIAYAQANFTLQKFGEAYKKLIYS
jgi:L-malate glycosyltransferase